MGKKELDCYHVDSVQNLEDYMLKFDKRITDFDLQLEGNLAYIYYLDKEKTVLLPNEIKDLNQGFLFQSRECLRDMINNDYYPINNPLKSTFEIEKEKILEITTSIDYYKDYLNRSLKLSIEEINFEQLDFYYDKLLQLHNNTQTSPKDFLALGILIGDEIRKSKKGKWILIKKYGMYNPYYIPHIITNDGFIISIFDKLDSYVSRQLNTISNIDKLPTITNPRKNLENMNLTKKEYVIL